MKDGVEIYENLGWDLKQSGSQLLAECPFCKKEKMYVDPDRGVFNCKKCGKSGNQTSVMGILFDQVYRKGLTTERKKHLADFRKMPLAMIEADKNLGYDPMMKKFVWLVKKNDGGPVTIRKVVFKTVGVKRKAIIMNTKGTNVGLLGLEELPKDKSVPIFLAEGEWDRMAMIYLLQELDMPGVVFAAPGAGTFKDTWSLFLKDRTVYVLYDNDDPGQDGAVTVFKRLKPYAKSLRFLFWDEDKPDGYDIHDLIKDNLKNLSVAYKYIIENTNHKEPKNKPESKAEAEKQSEEHEQDSLPPMSVEELHSTFHKWLHLQNCDLLDTVMGCLWSIYLPGSPLWMFIVAPPSGSKSETLMPASEWHRCFPISNVTARGLISGYQLQGGEDPSLFASLQGHPAAIIVKDMTPVLNGPETEREEIFGILRDAYDGAVQKVFGNGVRRVYEDLRFAFIAGVTPAIDGFDSVALGERFLKFRSDKELERADDTDRAMKAILNCGNETKMKEELREACVRTLIRKFDPDKVLVPDEKFARIISRLAAFCAKMRAVAPSDKFSDIQSMSPLRESPTRLAVQFTKLAQGLALHFEADDLCDSRVLRLVKRVAVHTPDIVTMRVVQAMYELNHATMADLGMIREKIPSLSTSTISYVTTKLARTKAVDVHKRDDTRGYRLSDETYKTIKDLGLFDNLPKNDPLHRGKRFIIGAK